MRKDPTDKGIALICKRHKIKGDQITYIGISVGKRQLTVEITSELSKRCARIQGKQKLHSDVNIMKSKVIK